jgi:ribonuclease Z
MRPGPPRLEHPRPRSIVHLNIWKGRLANLGLPVGSWLRDLKQAVMEGRPEDLLLVFRRAGSARSRDPAAALSALLTVVATLTQS